MVEIFDEESVLTLFRAHFLFNPVQNRTSRKDNIPYDIQSKELQDFSKGCLMNNKNLNNFHLSAPGAAKPFEQD